MRSGVRSSEHTGLACTHSNAPSMHTDIELQGSAGVEVRANMISMRCHCCYSEGFQDITKALRRLHNACFIKYTVDASCMGHPSTAQQLSILQTC